MTRQFPDYHIIHTNIHSLTDFVIHLPKALVSENESPRSLQNPEGQYYKDQCKHQHNPERINSPVRKQKTFKKLRLYVFRDNIWNKGIASVSSYTISQRSTDHCLNVLQSIDVLVDQRITIWVTFEIKTRYHVSLFDVVEQLAGRNFFNLKKMHQDQTEGNV